MALERIKVVEEFLSQNSVPSNISRMALGNAYYMAARLVFFDSNVPGRKYLFKAFYLRKGWVEEARLHIVAYIFLMPFSAVVYQKVKSLLPQPGTLK
jgi:hypothetical protein